ncbi:MAG TPA: SusC/RagA family TonB-linked outer membrane protein [Niabella sp.]|nr:SusC/RagA family TonB-linked outer membrane protein [Niabella sp.]HQW13733.1 SusC/RagA family TonB-linked outer membrane protein [Niabella sp.]HQX19128.1 SusC/RagA family TonB-linked outer membrane protein [Niabella sp.]HRB06417.1 SusC/RagA family TonB-linked outer membrane protein [Niabella sp.]HRB34279.1 SusC/RagA family TonB-linked outer membrane protein [Niabella sp.]
MFCTNVSAVVYSQKISIHFSRTNLEKAFSLIEKNTKYRFVYNDNYIPFNHRVSLDAKNVTIEELMEQLVSGTKLGYRMLSQNLVVIAPIGSEKKDVTVKGKVVNKLGEALQGVTIQLKNTNVISTTDKAGGYEIQVPENAVLLFSFIGYEAQEIAVDGRTSVNVTLNAVENSLNEVVIVGYGAEKKINITGAVDQISGKKLAERPIANLFQGLQGISPGLNITYPGGRPGTTPSINVRGITTLTGGGSPPLIIIDGIASTVDDIMRLNPQDIGSMSVLRDAASAAIYGARAAFGVVLITTKSGASGGKQAISYNNYFSWSKRTVLPNQITDPYIYSRVLETATDNTPWDYVNYSDYTYQWAKERSENPSVEDTRVDPNDPTKWIYMGNNNWNDYFFNKSSSSQNHSLSFSGGSEIGKGKPFGYLLSADWTKENGLNKLAKDDWNRHGLRAKLNFTPLSWLKTENNLNIYQTITDEPSYNITDLYYLQPTQVAKNPDSTWANTAAGRLGAQLSGGGRDKSTRFGFQNIFRGTASFLNNDLQIVGSASIKREIWKYNTDFRKYKIGYGPNDVREEGGNGSVSATNGVVKHDVYDLYATYNKTIATDHAFKLLAGYNQEEYDWSYEQVGRDKLISSSLPYIYLTTGDKPSLDAGYSTYALQSVFGRLNYTFKGRYILEGNSRYDGSSRFPKQRRWGFFPSVSAAWIVSNEPFFQSIKNQVSSLKIRASYGDLGNQSVSNFGYIQTLPTSTSSYLINNSFPTIISGAPPLSVDPDTYTWERVTTFNLGGDFGLFRNKIQASFDYFIRKTIGMLGPVKELPGVLGTSPPTQNVADLATKGWELSLGYRDNFDVGAKPFSFGARVILSDSRSKITKYKNDQMLLSSYRVGQNLGDIWGLENDGYFASQAEIDALNESAIVPWGALDIVPGWPKYVDLDNDKKIEMGNTSLKPKDLKIIGNSMARYRFGVNLDFDWNNIDLAVFLQGVAKQDYYPRHYLFWGPYQQPYAGVYEWNLDYYRGKSETSAERAKHSASYIAAGLADENKNAYFPILQSWLADANYGGGLDIPQTKYLQNAAYLRIKNVTLGYSLPNSVVRRIRLNRVRVFFTGENLFEFSSIKKYIDPEAVADGYGWAYPYQRKYAFGINLDF